ncbi:hypothetical protein GQR58_022126 [Nymphon striatum]|nr:hypothetical protein GQR58_022126 [Nymphon striatum]
MTNTKNQDSVLQTSIGILVEEKTELQSALSQSQIAVKPNTGEVEELDGMSRLSTVPVSEESKPIQLKFRIKYFVDSLSRLSRGLIPTSAFKRTTFVAHDYDSDKKWVLAMTVVHLENDLANMNTKYPEDIFNKEYDVIVANRWSGSATTIHCSTLKFMELKENAAKSSIYKQIVQQNNDFLQKIYNLEIYGHHAYELQQV